jgi:hypothetical protein
LTYEEGNSIVRHPSSENSLTVSLQLGRLLVDEVLYGDAKCLLYDEPVSKTAILRSDILLK